jgi:hypothetical protein
VTRRIELCICVADDIHKNVERNGSSRIQKRQCGATWSINEQSGVDQEMSHEAQRQNGRWAEDLGGVGGKPTGVTSPSACDEPITKMRDEKSLGFLASFSVLLESLEQD